MQRRIRTFVEEYNRRNGATVLLTSHYMADVEALCKRVIVIHNGKLLFDGNLSALVDRFSAFKTIGVTTGDGTMGWSQYGEVLNQEMGRVTLRVPEREDPSGDGPHPCRKAGGRSDHGGPADRGCDREGLCTKKRGGSFHVRRYVDFYMTSMKIGLLTQLQYRVAKLFLHDRYDGGTGHLSGRVVHHRQVTRRIGRRLHAGGDRSLLHRVDARAQHEYCLHAVRMGGTAAARATLRRIAAANPSAPLRCGLFCGMEARCDRSLVAAGCCAGADLQAGA